MLHSLELENFKAFGERARIPFAPITLIFGENSAGKSTILQALNLLKQTLESQEAGTLLIFQAENGIVDLGKFQEFLFDHDLERTLSIRVEIAIDALDIDYPPVPIYTSNEIGIELSFRRPSLKEDVLLDQIGIYDGKSSKCIAKFKPLGQMTEISVNFADYSRPPSPLTAARYIWLTQEPEYWEPQFRYHKERKEVILQLLKYRVQNLLKDDSEKDLHFLNDSLDALEDFIEFFSSDFDLETYISKMHKEEMERDISLGVSGFFPIRSLLRPTVLGVSAANELAIIAGEALKQTLEELFPMRPFRKPPERWYTFGGTTPQHVGYQGDLLPDLLFRRPELVEKTNKWLKRLDIDYELTVKSVGTDSDDLFEVRLIDGRRKEPVSVALADVGYGISQILPFLVQSLVSEKRIISIEQPEVHVHPRLQADLGDLLVEAVREPRQNQFIIETHSEHLILRLQRLVYEKQIKPEDVSVIYVSRGPEGAKAERLNLDEEGDFIDEWPNGFFLERLRELR